MVLARSVILAMGGLSYPGCGTTGDGYAIARGFGHSIIEPRPALVPLRKSIPPWASELRGHHAPRRPGERGPSRTSPAGNSWSRREAVLFAHFGLTGPAILDVSRAVATERRPASDSTLQAWT